VLQQTGEVLYNKKPCSEFVVERTAAYVDQVWDQGSLHIAARTHSTATLAYWIYPKIN
jgi:hypothetical protein